MYSLAILSRAFVLSVLLGFQYIHSSDGEPIHQRCRLDGGAKDQPEPEALQGWFDAPCKFCDKKQYRNATKRDKETHPISKRFHAVIQLTTPQLEPELLSIAAGLLKDHAFVSLFFMDFERATTREYVHILFRQILSGVPCVDHQRLQQRLAIRSIAMAPSVRQYCSETINSTTSFVDPLQSCIVLMATSQYRAYSQLWKDGATKNLVYPINVVVTDLWGMGGIGLAEEYGIPSIVLSDQGSFEKAIGNAAKPTIQQQISALPGEILRSLSGIVSFAGLNQLRKALDLKRKRHRSEYWDAVTSILVLPNRYNGSTARMKQPYPSVMHLEGPILAPCLACNPNTTDPSINDKPTKQTDVVVIVRLPNDIAAKSSRELVRALVLARKSLLSHNAGCHKGASNCWHDRMSMRIIWMINKDSSNLPSLLPNPVPAFLEIQDASLFVDSVVQAVQENNPTIVLSRCDNEARDSLLLGLPTLCFPGSSYVRDQPTDNLQFLQSMKAPAVARQLLGFLWSLEKSLRPLKNKRDSLERALDAIRTAGSLRPVRAVGKSDATTPRELQRLYAQIMGYKDVLISPQDAEPSVIYVVLSWTSFGIFALFLVYLVTKLAFPRFLKLPRSARRNIDNVFFEAPLARLPEVDNVWGALGELWNDNRRERRELVNGNDSNGRHKTRFSENTNSGRNASNRQSTSKKRLGKHR